MSAETPTRQLHDVEALLRSAEPGLRRLRAVRDELERLTASPDL